MNKKEEIKYKYIYKWMYKGMLKWEWDNQRKTNYEVFLVSNTKQNKKKDDKKLMWAKKAKIFNDYELKSENLIL